MPETPPITHLQFLVLTHLHGGVLSGISLREALEEEGVKKSLPSFYQLMFRLEESKFVRGWYEQVTVGETICRERKYEIIAGGREAARECAEFYAARSGVWRLA